MTAEPDPYTTCIDPEPLVKMAARRGVRRDFYVAHHLPADHEGRDFYAAYRARNRGYRCYIGYTMFETDRLPASWAEACNGMHEIWVPSRFNEETFARSGVDPEKLHRIPVGFDPAPFEKLPVKACIPGARGFNFLSVFQWTHRKGPDLLLKAYLEAFEPKEDVCLLIRSFGLKGESVSGRLMDLIRSLGRDPETIPDVVLLDEPIAEREMPALYRASQAFVLPSRGEGWGLPYIEAMACGLPVIGTRWSGNLEFMHNENSYLIDIKGLEPVHVDEVREMPLYEGHCYAEPDVEDLKRQMRHVFEHHEEGREKGALARDEVLNCWTQHHATEKMLERFRTWRRRWRNEARTTVSLRGKTDDAFTESLRAEPDIAVVPTRSRVTVHCGDPTRHVLDERAEFNVSRCLFHTDALPAGWVETLKSFHEVWVPSDYNLRSFHEAGVDWDRLVKIPGCVDAYRFGPHLEKCTIEPGLGFVFLSVFPWSLKAGWDRLLEAYCKAFDSKDDVTLFLKVQPTAWKNQDAIEEEMFSHLWQKLALTPERCPTIKLHTDSFLDMELLYRAADAFALPTRGEGWGQHLLEALASGLPTVATRHGGHLEFMNERNSRLLDFERVPVPQEGIEEHPDYQGHHWAEPDGNDLERALREIFEDRASWTQRGAMAREEVAEKFSMQRSASAVKERLERIGCKAKAPSEKGTRLVMEGSFFCMSSMALVNREAGRALVKRGHVALSSLPLEEEGALDPSEEDRFHALRARVNHGFRKPAEVHVWHQWPPSAAVPPSGRWVVWQGWEYGSLPEKILALVHGGVDEIWTYSNHCARELASDGLPEEKIGVIPLGVDPDRFKPHAPVPDRFKRLTEKKIKFLFVGGTIWRKGIDLLLSSFCRAFSRDDDVALVVKEMGSDTFYQKYNLTETVERLATFSQSPEIILLKDPLTDAEMPGLYNACTCLVHPYRGEGFGLPVLEAMACGLPVIVTAGGACDDFVRPEAAFTLPAHKRTVDLPFKTARPAWVLEPDRAVLIRSLRRMAEYPDPALAKALAESEAIRRDWTWQQTAASIEERCARLTSK